MKAVIRDRGRNYITPTVTAVGTTENRVYRNDRFYYYCQVLRNPALDDIGGARITSSPIQLFNRRQPRISLARI